MMHSAGPCVHRRSVAIRLASILLAAFQVVGPGLVAWADGRLEAEARANPATSHIESKTTKHCPRVHADDCALCQYLSATSGRPATAPVSLAALAVAARPLASQSARVPRRSTATLPPSRAPPPALVA